MTSALLPRPAQPLRIVILGLSITSSWGNGHATTFRSLVRALCQRGHKVLFLERDTPWYGANRDPVQFPVGSVQLYYSLGELRDRWRKRLAEADLVIVALMYPMGSPSLSSSTRLLTASLPSTTSTRRSRSPVSLPATALM